MLTLAWRMTAMTRSYLLWNTSSFRSMRKLKSSVYWFMMCAFLAIWGTRTTNCWGAHVTLLHIFDCYSVSHSNGRSYFTTCTPSSLSHAHTLTWNLMSKNCEQRFIFLQFLTSNTPPFASRFRIYISMYTYSTAAFVNQFQHKLCWSRNQVCVRENGWMRKCRWAWKQE